MKVFERPGPVNTEDIVNIIKNSSNIDYMVVASITGDSALKIAKEVKNKKIICVTSPQGMYWEVDGMNKDLFAEIPELKEKRDEWVEKGLNNVPMNITDENKAKLE